MSGYKILIINIAPIGDVILSSAAVSAVRTMYPKAFITLRVPAACGELLNEPAVVDRVDIDAPPKKGFFLSCFRSAVAWKYKREKYDICFFFEENKGMAKRLLFIPHRVCSSHRPGGKVNPLAEHCSHVVERADKNSHMVDFYKKIVCEDSICRELPWIRTTEAPELSGGRGKNIALCFDFSERNRHRWPQGHSIALLQALAAKGYKLHLFLAPGSDSPTLRAAESAGVSLCVREGSLFSSANSLRSMDLLISVDTGQVHLAAAMGTPVLSLAGLTPAKTYPYTDSGVAITVSDGCEQCSFLGQCKSNKVNRLPIPTGYSPPCMVNLLPKVVLAYAERMMSNPFFPEKFIRVDQQPLPL